MDLELLGQEIMALREWASLSRNQFASQLGWRGSTPVHRIESGNSRPNPETLERISDLFDVPLTQYFYYLGLAGYLPITYLPKKSILIPILEEVMQEIANDPNPVFIRDYKHVIWGLNPPMMRFMERIGCSKEEIEAWMTKANSSFDGVCASKLLDEEHVQQYLHQQLYLFKLNNIYRQHEPFYRKYPNKNQRTSQLLQPSWDAVNIQNGMINNGKLSGLRVWQDLQQSYKRVIEQIVGLDYRFHIVRYIPEYSVKPQKQDTSMRLWELVVLNDEQLHSWSYD